MPAKRVLLGVGSSELDAGFNLDTSLLSMLTLEFGVEPPQAESSGEALDFHGYEHMLRTGE